jgi:hypothetical protein
LSGSAGLAHSRFQRSIQTATFAQRSGELDLAFPNAGQTAHEFHPERCERIQIGVPPVGVARELERGQAAGAPQILNLVVALIV